MVQVGSHIEDTLEAVHNVLPGEAHSAPELLDPERMAQEDTVPDAQDPEVALEEQNLAAASGMHLCHLWEAQGVHEEILGCSIVPSHVPQTMGTVDAERVVLQSQP